MRYSLQEYSEQERLFRFTKSLDHDSSGVVDAEQFEALMGAVVNKDNRSLEKLLAALSKPFAMVSPSSGFPSAMYPALVGSATGSITKAQDYVNNVAYMAANRDVPFETLEASNGQWRPEWPGVSEGGWFSQFLYKPYSIGAMDVQQLYNVYQPGIDYMTSSEEWLNVQNGGSVLPPIVSETKKYLQTPRDIASFVHRDKDQQYLGAVWILIANGVPPDDGLRPYWQAEFVGGLPLICRLIEESIYVALRAAWVNKYSIQNTLARPEAYAGILELLPHVLPDSIVDYLQADDYVSSLYNDNGNYFLPMAFPEGSPCHPTFPAGHGTSAIAACTMLKIVFDSDAILTNLVGPNEDGSQLVNVPGELTVVGELNKLASNVGSGRTCAGVHFWEDNIPVSLGEMVAESVFLSAIAQCPDPISCSYKNMQGNTVVLSNVR